MKNWMRLVVAGAVGVLAAILNQASLKSVAPPTEYVRVKESLQAGHRLTDGDLEVLPLTGDVEVLKKSVVLWSEKASIIGLQVGRRFNPAEPLLWRDINPPAAALLRQNERAVHIPLAGLQCPPDLLRINTNMSFLVPAGATTAGRSITPATPGSGRTGVNTQPTPGSPAVEVAGFNRIGPFRIIGIGGNLIVDRTAAPGGGQTGELTIAVEVKGDGTYPADVVELLKLSQNRSIAAGTIIPELQLGAGLGTE